MDFTELNVKMCEKAEEIQQSRKLNDMEWKAGDWGYWPPSGDINVIYDAEYQPCELGKGHIWLPGQDDLQEMMELPSPFHLLERLNGWITTETHGQNPAKYETMEQLWLAFVMKQKYNKVWNGKDWEYESSKKGQN